jgi:FKBP-type peptidyl-prolyl cis-trans isomerase FklB
VFQIILIKNSYLRAHKKKNLMNKQIIALAICFCTVALLSCEGQKSKSKVNLKTQADSVAYSIGVSIGGNMKKDGLDSLNLDLLKAGMSAVLSGDSVLLDANQCQTVIQSYLSAKQNAKGSANGDAAKKFLAENKSKPGVVELPDGLQYIVMKEGTGPKPTANDTVKVHYHGTLIDGTVFDSSVERGEPAEFPVGAVIPGWTEALQLMSVGSKYKLFIPPALAYGDRQAGPKIGANSMLIFEVELLSIKGK